MKNQPWSLRWFTWNKGPPGRFGDEISLETIMASKTIFHFGGACFFSHNSWKWKPTLRDPFFTEPWLCEEGYWTMSFTEPCQHFASLPKNHEQIMLLLFCHDQAQIIGVYYGIAVCFNYFLSSRGRSQFWFTGFTQTSKIVSLIQPMGKLIFIYWHHHLLVFFASRVWLNLIFTSWCL